MTSIWWIRRDLRLTDNPALHTALAAELRGSGIQILGFSPGMMLTDMLTNPTVVGERGREMMKNYGFVLRFLGRPPKYAADKLVKTIEAHRREFGEVRLFKPWTPLFELVRLGWENLTRSGTTPEFELRYQEAYQPKHGTKVPMDHS